MLAASMLLGALLPACATVVDPSQVSHYDVIRAPGPVVVDGAITDKEWGRRPRSRPFTDIADPAKPPRQAITAKMSGMTPTCTFAYDCVDDDIWNPVSTTTTWSTTGRRRRGIHRPGRQRAELPGDRTQSIQRGDGYDCPAARACNGDQPPILARYDTRA